MSSVCVCLQFNTDNKSFASRNLITIVNRQLSFLPSNGIYINCLLIINYILLYFFHNNYYFYNSYCFRKKCLIVAVQVV